MKGHDFQSLIDTGTIFLPFYALYRQARFILLSTPFNALHPCNIFYRANRGIHTCNHTISFRPLMERQSNEGGIWEIRLFCNKDIILYNNWIQFR